MRHVATVVLVAIAGALAYGMASAANYAFARSPGTFITSAFFTLLVAALSRPRAFGKFTETSARRLRDFGTTFVGAVALGCLHNYLRFEQVFATAFQIDYHVDIWRAYDEMSPYILASVQTGVWYETLLLYLMRAVALFVFVAVPVITWQFFTAHVVHARPDALPADGIDRERKIITRTALQHLQRGSERPVDAAGWRILER